MYLHKITVSTLLLLLISVSLVAQPVRENRNFDDNWKFNLGDLHGAQFSSFDDSEWRTLDLPHDWSIEGKFSKEYASGQGYLPGGIGRYRKAFKLSGDQKGRSCSTGCIKTQRCGLTASTWANARMALSVLAMI